MKAAVFYHWWAEPSDVPYVYQNIRSPILLAIASLRAQNPDIPIIVMDGSDREIWEKTPDRWGNYPEKLNFTIQRQKFHLQHYSHRPGFKHLSRIFDIRRYLEKPQTRPIALYADADVFWFHDPLPLYSDPDKFCFDGHNTGYFYFNQYSRETNRFLEIFEAYSIAALNSPETREVMKKYVGYKGWHYVFDEQITTYMHHEHPELFNKISLVEHAASRSLHLVDVRKMKMFHSNGTMVGNAVPKIEGERHHSRGLLCLIWKELYDSVTKVLDLEEVFTQMELEYYLPRQFSLYEDKQRVINTEKEDKHFYIEKCFDPPVTMI